MKLPARRTVAQRTDPAIDEDDTLKRGEIADEAPVPCVGEAERDVEGSTFRSLKQ